MEEIEKYILRTKTERQKHLRLAEPCIERGGPERGGLSAYCKGLLAHILDTSIPTGHKIHVCHACNNERCSNPDHLYWGTAQENRQDQIATGTDKSIWQRTIEKYGVEEAKRINSDIAKKAAARRLTAKSLNVSIDTQTCPGGGTVDTSVLEADAERRESSSLS